MTFIVVLRLTMQAYPVTLTGKKIKIKHYLMQLLLDVQADREKLNTSLQARFSLVAVLVRPNLIKTSKTKRLDEPK